MNQRGRKSAAALAVVSEIADHRPEPPESLSEKEAGFWRSVVKTRPADWWDAASIPLLAEYCRLRVSIDLLAAQVERSEAEIDLTGVLPDGYKDLTLIVDRKQARLVQLAMKMRLTQQSRYDRSVASTRTKRAQETARSSRIWDSGG